MQKEGTTKTVRPLKVKASKTSSKNQADINGHKKEFTVKQMENHFSFGAADDKDLLSIISTVRTGITPSAFTKMVDATPFSLTEWAHFLQVSDRTIQRNIKEKKSFQPVQSERIVELMMLYNYGVEVFGDKENFNTWLTSKSIALGGRTPKELLDTKFGITMVKDELGRIEHGVLA